MYPHDQQRPDLVFTRVEHSYLRDLTPTALRAYVATRSFSNGHGKVSNVPQQRIAARSGVGRSQYLKGLREAQEAGAVASRRVPGGVTYTFTKTDPRFAAVPNVVLTQALTDLTGRDLQVLLATYLHASTETGVTWVSPTTVGELVGMSKANVCRSLRAIEEAGLAVRCDSPECPAPKPHWHLTTYKQGPVYDTNRCHMPDTLGVTDRTKGCHMPNTIEDQGEDQGEDHGTRELRSQSPESEIDPFAAVGWQSQERGQKESQPHAPQTILAREFRDAVRAVKPGIQWRKDEYAIHTRWFRQRLEGGWDLYTARTAISRFVEDESTPRSLGSHRPHVAFFSFAARKEGSFSATTTTEMSEVERRRDTEVRQRLRDLDERRRQRREENRRWEQG